MKLATIIIAITALVVAGPASAACPPMKHKPAPRVIAHKPTPKSTKPKPPVVDRVPDLRTAQVNREGYCVNGKFFDMIVGQLEITDTVTYARYYNGVGITCDRLPGYTFQNSYIGNYAYFA